MNGTVQDHEIGNLGQLSCMQLLVTALGKIVKEMSKEWLGEFSSGHNAKLCPV